MEITKCIEKQEKRRRKTTQHNKADSHNTFSTIPNQQRSSACKQA